MSTDEFTAGIASVAQDAAQQASAISYSSWLASIYGAITSEGNKNGVGEGPQATNTADSTRSSHGAGRTTAAAASSSTASSSSSRTRSRHTRSSAPTSTQTPTMSSIASTSDTTMQTITSSPTSMPSSAASLSASSGHSAPSSVEHHHKPSGGGLSGGAIAGIVIGVLAAALVLGVLVFFCCCRKALKKRRERKAATEINNEKGTRAPTPGPQATPAPVAAAAPPPVHQARDAGYPPPVSHNGLNGAPPTESREQLLGMGVPRNMGPNDTGSPNGQVPANMDVPPRREIPQRPQPPHEPTIQEQPESPEIPQRRDLASQLPPAPATPTGYAHDIASRVSMAPLVAGGAAGAGAGLLGGGAMVAAASRHSADPHMSYIPGDDGLVQPHTPRDSASTTNTDTLDIGKYNREREDSHAMPASYYQNMRQPTTEQSYTPDQSQQQQPQQQQHSRGESLATTDTATTNPYDYHTPRLDTAQQTMTNGSSAMSPVSPMTTSELRQSGDQGGDRHRWTKYSDFGNPFKDDGSSQPRFSAGSVEEWAQGVHTAAGERMRRMQVVNK